MASEVGQAYLTVLPSARGFGSSLQRQVGGEVATAGTAMGKESSKRYRSAFLGGLKGMATGMGAFLALDKTVEFFSDAIAEAREAEKVGSRTANVIKSTGQAAGVTAKQVADLAESLSNKVGQDDEAIQSGENLLLTFKNLRDEQGKGNDVFTQTTGLMVDMSAAMDQDMKSSAIQLGKALNDPTKGLSALSRVGVTFTAGQEKQIKHLQKTGDLMGAQKVILHELKSEFGGAGEAMADPFDKAQVAWANAKEDVGTKLMPVLSRLADWFTEDGLPGIQRFAKKYGPDIKEFGSNLKDAGEDIMPVAKKALPILADTLGSTAKAIGSIAKEFNKLPEGLQTAIITGALFGVGAKKFGLLGRGGAAVGGAAVGGAAVGGGAAATGGVAVGAGESLTAFTRLTNSPLLRKAGWAGLALGTYDAAKQVKGLQTNTDRLNGSVGRIRQELEDSAVGDYADDLGIDVDRLAQNLARYGSKGDYVREVNRKLTVTNENMGESLWREVINPFTQTNDRVEQAGSAFRSLLPTIDRNIDKQHSNAKALKGTRDSAGALVDFYNGALPKSMRLSEDEADDLTKHIKGIPDRHDTKVNVDKNQAERDTSAFVRSFNTLLGGIDDEKVGIDLSAGAKSAIGGVGALFTGGLSLLGKGHASGGAIKGPGTGTSDSILARLSTGEHVFTADDVRKAGGQSAMYAIRKMIQRGEFAKKGDLQYYKAGGAVGFDIRDSGTAGAIGSVERLFAAIAGGVSQELSTQVSRRIVQNLATGGGRPLGPNGSLSMGQIAIGQRFAQSQAGLPYQWGGTGNPSWDCSGFVGGVLLAALGQNPRQRIGTTASMPWAGFSPGTGTFTTGTDPGSHMDGNIGGLGIESRGGDGVTLGSGITPISSFARIDHYDRGGVLRPGWTAAYNGTGRDEYVSKAKPRSRGPMRVRLDFGSGRTLDGWIDDRVDSALDFEASSGRM